MKQLLINVDDEGGLHAYELHATVPSGMSVMLGEMRTHECPIGVKLTPVYSGERVSDLSFLVQAFRANHLATLNDPLPPREPWSR
jgi:hypothetical protein